MNAPQGLTIGQLASLACTLEVCAPKPGNVHRSADFEDVTLQDFLASAIAIGPVFDQAPSLSLGQLILQSVAATSRMTRTNTNLGMLLLMAPLAMPQDAANLQQDAAAAIENSTAQDAADIYAAINLAKPGGMNTSAEHDIAGSAPPHILDAMKLAADRDSIARQYTTSLADLFDQVVPLLTDTTHKHLPLSQRIVHTHVCLMAQMPDTLIARKNGDETALQSTMLAKRVIDAGPPMEDDYMQQLGNLDFWLRCNGHKRNPGTTADLIAAGLFVCLRQKTIVAPFV
ncbi:triphosphoribosyl-dephospho-CoA synthetase [Blastopirellula marina]|uniref:Triphosphoribosyl-dephospho-CoA synthetase n=1 Tax=Blastopirellula marina TaxID=124 RepID=A0A2S8FML3_9BACT|nr:MULTISPECIES: triphosphoribosyl-dephospho-CoA synthase [Pirellulaceae]PQO33425.1 triphosphoribosyl-dephospho-CoA synthetase [Blastopirellula marina]RCS52515.1 triphosphoribosyl-dephospho-CoA synthetase [Bremerella cremea]